MGYTKRGPHDEGPLLADNVDPILVNPSLLIGGCSPAKIIIPLNPETPTY